MIRLMVKRMMMTSFYFHYHYRLYFVTCSFSPNNKLSSNKMVCSVILDSNCMYSNKSLSQYVRNTRHDTMNTMIEQKQNDFNFVFTTRLPSSTILFNTKETQGNGRSDIVTAIFSNHSKQHGIATSTLYSASERAIEYGGTVEKTGMDERRYSLVITEGKEYLFTPYEECDDDDNEDEDADIESEVKVEMNSNGDQNGQSGELQIDYIQIALPQLQIEEEEEN